MRVGLSREHLHDGLGPHGEPIPLGKGESLVLFTPNSPEGLLPNAFEYDLDLLNQSFRERGEVALRYPICSLSRETGRGTG